MEDFLRVVFFDEQLRAGDDERFLLALLAAPIGIVLHRGCADVGEILAMDRFEESVIASAGGF